MIKANDTDVIVIAMFVLPSLKELGLQQMRVLFGQGPTITWIPVHEVVATIGPQKALGILFFMHSLGAILYLPFGARVRSPHGSRGMCAMR